MKIKIESAWKSLCYAFPKLKDNPLYKGWYISYAILVTLSILTVVVVNHRIVYSFPFDWFGLLFGIILPWVLTTFYIVYQGVDHAHQFTSTKVVLGLFMLPVILIGFTSSYKNEYSYSNRMVRRFLIRNSRNKVSTQQRLHQTSLIILKKIMSFFLIRKILLQRYMCSFDLIALTVKNQFQYSIRA